MDQILQMLNDPNPGVREAAVSCIEVRKIAVHCFSPILPTITATFTITCAAAAPPPPTTSTTTTKYHHHQVLKHDMSYKLRYLYYV